MDKRYMFTIYTVVTIISLVFLRAQLTYIALINLDFNTQKETLFSDQRLLTVFVRLRSAEEHIFRMCCILNVTPVGRPLNITYSI
jgi:hypothetical protein